MSSTSMEAQLTMLHRCGGTHLSEQMLPLCALRQGQTSMYLSRIRQCSQSVNHWKPVLTKTDCGDRGARVEFEMQRYAHCDCVNKALRI